MSYEQEPETQNTPAPEMYAQPAPGPRAAGPQPLFAAANSRKRFCTEEQIETLFALGEDPRDYERIMKSLVEDLEPREGLETELVEQMGETFWQMRRTQRIRDGLALKSIQNKLEPEMMAATKKASQAIELLEPFKQLEQALSSRGGGPSAAEIDAFVRGHKGDSSEEMREFIVLLQSLKAPMEERQRREVRRKARTQLQPLMEPYEDIAGRYSRQCERVNSSKNLATMMATEDYKAVLLQRKDDANLRRLSCLTNTLAKVRQGALHKKEAKNLRANPECV